MATKNRTFMSGGVDSTPKKTRQGRGAHTKYSATSRIKTRNWHFF